MLLQVFLYLKLRLKFLHFFFYIPYSSWKLCFWASITPSYTCLTVSISLTISGITFFFYICIFPFSNKISWISNCLRTASDDFPALIITRNFTCFIAFPLVTLKTPIFLPLFLFDYFLCLYIDNSCSCPSRVDVVIVNCTNACLVPSALGMSLSISSYSPIIRSLYTNILLEMIQFLFKNDQLVGIQVRYMIKNRFLVLGKGTAFHIVLFQYSSLTI